MDNKIYILNLLIADLRGIDIMNFKKGFLFSIFVLTTLTLIVVLFKTKTEFKEADRADYFKERVEQINLFIIKIESDLDRSLDIVAQRSFQGMNEYIRKEDKFIDNVSKRISEAMLNGTVNGTTVSVTDESSVNEWMDRIEDISEFYRINVSLKDPKISVKHAGPFLLNINFSTNVSVEDYENTLSWNYMIYKAIIFDIRDKNITDPLYDLKGRENYILHKGSSPSINLRSVISRNIHTNYWQNDSGTINASKLANYTISSMYNKSGTGPTFLMRLEGKTDCSDADYTAQCQEFGIESFVNVITDSDIFDYSYSGGSTCAVDYQFFEEGCADMHRIENMTNRFYLDWDYVKRYNLTKINST